MPRELIKPRVAEHRGRIVKTAGDGALVEFASAIDAVRCAVEVQRGMAERNARLPGDHRIEFRIAINVGDIVSDDGDIYGGGVNVAARLDGIAEPGGICVSSRVQEDVEGRLDITFGSGALSDRRTLSCEGNFRSGSKRITSLISKLGDLGDYVKDLPFTGYAASAAWASNHPAAVLAFLSGCREAVAWFYSVPRGRSELAALATLFTPKA
jgi:hypothetical protein